MNKTSPTLLSIIVLMTFFISSCGVSDYINRKKVAKANAKLTEIEKRDSKLTGKCDNNQLRVERIIKYINRARAVKRQCGDKSYAAAPAIGWNIKLFAAASLHSNDMAENNFFSHTGSNNSTTGERVTDVYYDWKAVAENISAGTITPEQTIDRWLASPGHCHNLMNPVYVEIGLACTINPDTEYEIYWTLVLAAAR